MPKKKISALFTRWLPPLVWVYFTVLFGWFVLYLLLGDQQGYIALVNQMAHLLFFPLPLVLLLAFFLKRREIRIGFGIGMVLFAWLWGSQFIPKPQGEGQLKVMTYNTLGPHQFTEPAIEVILEEDADLVFIQELNPELAAAIGEALIEGYPYQALDSQVGPTGMGVISKYPISLSDEHLPLEWVGVPQVLLLDWEGQQIAIVNFHMWAVGIAPAYYIEQNFRGREAQAEALADFVQKMDLPLIVAGDANTASLSDAYKVLMGVGLRDAWREAGFGFGHTFPGSDNPGGNRPKIGEWSVPQWLVRIDYVFISADWQAVGAHLAPFDGVSDHRGVVVELNFVPQP
jgi:endonuclease/exonuclease/phosphatase (EEP) superfamily protein YafD